MSIEFNLGGAFSGAVAGFQVGSWYGAIIGFFVGGFAGADAQRSARHKAQSAYNNAQQDRAQMVQSATAPHNIVYGEALASGPLAYAEPSGDKGQYLHLVVMLASHEVDSIGEVYLGDTPVGPLDSDGFATSGSAFGVSNKASTSQNFAGTPSSVTLSNTPTNIVHVKAYGGSGGENWWQDLAYTHSGVNVSITDAYPSGAEGVQVFYEYQQSFSPLVRIRKHLGAPGQTADTQLIAESAGKWTTAQRLQGYAYLYVRLEYNVDVFSAVGIPQVRAVVKGRKVRDPRTGLTAWSDNAALCAADYLSTYMQAASDELIDAEIATAANVCDGLVTLDVAGTTQKRYTSNGVISTATAPKDNLDALLEAMAGTAPYVQGRFYLLAGADTSAVGAFNEDDLADGAIQIKPSRQRTELINRVVPRYVEPTKLYATVEATGVTNATYVAADGGLDLPSDVTYDLCTDQLRAQRLGKIALERNRQGLSVQLNFKLSAYGVAPGEKITLSLARYVWSAKQFIVESRILDVMAMQVKMILRETAAGVWDWNYGEATTVDLTPNTSLRSPFTRPAALSGIAVASGAAHLLQMGDGTIVVRGYVSWTASADAFVREGGRIEIQHALVNASAPVWQADAPVPGDAIGGYVGPLQDGQATLVRVRQVNAVGQASDWATISFVPVGKTAAPVDVSGLSVELLPGGAHFKWAADTTDDDYLQTVIRLGASWASGVLLFEAAATEYTWPWPAAGTYTAWVAHENRSGVYSTSPQSVSFTVTSDSVAVPRSRLETELGKVVDVVPAIRIDSSRQDLQLTAIAEAITRLSLKANAVDGVLRDAGIAVDPNNGTVKISGVEQTSAQLNQVSITLAATQAQLTLKASTTYVDQQIASAVLDGATVVFDALDTRLTNAEVDIDGLQASVTSKADLTTVNSQGVRLTTAESDISALTGTVATKASTTVTDGLNTRLTTAESSIGALGDQATAVRDLQAGQWRLQGQDDLSGVNTLQALLALWQSTQAINTALAYVHEEVTAKINGDVSAEAASRLLLAARVASAEAAILTEQTVRALADSATASTLSQVQARLDSGGDIASAIASTTTTATTALTNAATAQGTANTGVSNAAAAQATANAASAAAAAAQGTANTAVTNAAAAQAAADAANTALGNIASDSILSPVEKPAVVQAYAVITGEQAGIDAQATSYGITAEKAAYDSAVSALTSYLGGLSGWNTVPGSDVAIVGSTFRANFTAVYTARQALLDKIAATAKSLADAAQSTANSAGSAAAAAQGTANSAVSQVTTLQATVSSQGTSLASVQTQASATASDVTGLKSQYLMKVQAVRSDGKVVLGAIGLASSANNSGSQSEIILQADKLTFVPSSDPDAATQPLLTTGTNNGAPALVLRAALIGDLTVDTFNIKAGAATAAATQSSTAGSGVSWPNSASTATLVPGLEVQRTVGGWLTTVQMSGAVEAFATSGSVAYAEIFLRLQPIDASGNDLTGSRLFCDHVARVPVINGYGKTGFSVSVLLSGVSGLCRYRAQVFATAFSSAGTVIAPGAGSSVTVFGNVFIKEDKV